MGKDKKKKKKAKKEDGLFTEKEIKKISKLAEKTEKKAEKKLEKKLKKEVKKEKAKTKQYVAVPTGYKLDAKTVEMLHEKLNVEGFEGWYVTCNTKTDTDEKIVVNDFEISLFDDKNRLRGKAIGGIYDRARDIYTFNTDLEFIPQTPISKLNDFLQEVIDNEGKLSETERIKQIKKFISK